MKLRTLVVEDELEARNRLMLYLDKFPELHLLKASQNGKEALDTIRDEAPDIVFLDVEMPEMNGIDVLAHCEPPFPYIIFVTAYSQYAVEAFEQNAVDYILKPYTFERVEKALVRAIDMIKKDRLTNLDGNFQDLLLSLSGSTSVTPDSEYIKRIAVKSIGHTVFIPVETVLLIEAADQYVEVHTDKKKFVVRESMDSLESKLDPNLFFRTHRSAMVSLDQVRGLETVDKHSSLVLLQDGRKVKISNNRKKEFKEKMRF